MNNVDKLSRQDKAQAVFDALAKCQNCKHVECICWSFGSEFKTHYDNKMLNRLPVGLTRAMYLDKK